MPYQTLYKDKKWHIWKYSGNIYDEFIHHFCKDHGVAVINNVCTGCSAELPAILQYAIVSGVIRRCRIAQDKR